MAAKNVETASRAPRLSRREALIGLIALFGGGVLASPSQAMAATGNMQYGAGNNARTGDTWLASTSTLPTFEAGNNGTGSLAIGLSGHSAGPAPGIQGYSITGPGVEGVLTDTGNTSPAVHGSTSGTGAGLLGETSNASALGVHASHSASTGVALFAEAVDGGIAVKARAGSGGSSVDVLAPENGLGIVAVGAAGARAIYALSGGDQAAIHAQGAGTGPGLKSRASAGATAIDAAASSKGTGISTTAPSDGTALSVDGVATFSRAGRGSVAKKKQSVTVVVPSGLSASSLILVTLQNAPGGVALGYAAMSDTTHFRVVLSKKATATTYFSWFVVG